MVDSDIVGLLPFVPVMRGGDQDQGTQSVRLDALHLSPGQPARVSRYFWIRGRKTATSGCEEPPHAGS